MKFCVKIGQDFIFTNCTLPLGDITVDLSGEAGILIRNNGRDDVVLQRSTAIAVLTVARAPARMRTIAQRIEAIQRSNTGYNEGIEYRCAQSFLGVPCVASRRKKFCNTKACGAESPPNVAESHLPSGAWKRSHSAEEPKVSWYGAPNQLTNRIFGLPDISTQWD